MSYICCLAELEEFTFQWRPDPPISVSSPSSPGFVTPVESPAPFQDLQLQRAAPQCSISLCRGFLGQTWPENPWDFTARMPDKVAGADRPQAQTCHCCCALEPFRCIPAGLENWTMFRRSIYWTLGFLGFPSDCFRFQSWSIWDSDFLNLRLCTSRFDAMAKFDVMFQNKKQGGVLL